MWELPEISGSNIDPNSIGLLLEGHPQAGPAMYRNSHAGPALRPASDSLDLT